MLRRIVGLLALTGLALVTGCAGDIDPVGVGVPELVRPVVPPCEPGSHAPGEVFTAVDGAGNALEMTAGECFDTWVPEALVFGAGELAPQIIEACDGLEVDHQLNALLGHGVRQIGGAITGIDIGAVAGTCSFNEPVEEWEWRSLVGVTFTFIAPDGSADPAFFLEYSWESYVAALGGSYDPLPGYGIRAGVIDSITDRDGDLYTVLAQGSGGEIVRILTFFPDERRDEQLLINEQLASWLEVGLEAAAKLRP